MNNPKKILTLCLWQQGERLLLGKKKRGFGAGNWNGFGGKVTSGEQIEDAAKREMWEECGVTILEMEKRGVMRFTFADGNDDLEIHLFSVITARGEPLESDEMSPRWFPIHALPFDQMWADDIFWMPYFLDRTYFEGDFHFQDVHTLLEHKIFSS